MSLGDRLDGWVRGLYPGYFALVMATGIISDAFFDLDFRVISDVLFAVNLIAFPVLVAATVVRIARYPSRLWKDLSSPATVFSFFTIIAGSDVLGVQFLSRGHTAVAVCLWVFSLALWLMLSHFSFSILTFVYEGDGADIVHGGWLIAIVGTESLALLGVQIAGSLGSLGSAAFVACYMLWGIGIIFYGMFVTLFAYRIFFSPVSANDMNPLFWVVMGAAAISTNAGSTLSLTTTDLAFLDSMHSFIDGTTLILWAWATWWIPLLVTFAYWRYVVKKVKLAYSPMFWSLVFPLGMYAVATYRLSLASHFDPIRIVSNVMVWIALAAWLATMAGMLRAARRTLTAESG